MAYLEMGAPKSLTAQQLATLQELTRDAPESEWVQRTAVDGSIHLTVAMNSNDIVFVKMEREAAAHREARPARGTTVERKGQ